MSSKNQILTAIRQARLDQQAPLPTGINFPPFFPDRVTKFVEMLPAVGGKAVAADSFSDIKKRLSERFGSGENVACLVPELDWETLDLTKITDPHQFAHVELTVLRGQLGVAENGAIWLDERDMRGWRILPFITQHLAIVLDKKLIVNNMHEAYARLNVSENGFGVFLSGPSKTADIEQALVIGAHGARSLTVFLT
jgi:L-lactate dehydrogenase complex protein LldG